MKACIKNPKTGKSYSRHRYRQDGLRVETYSRSAYDGHMHPHSYAFELVCERCGFNRGTCRY